MELNGFNSDDYRYFKVINDVHFGCRLYKKGAIIKFNQDNFKKNLFNTNYDMIISNAFSYISREYIPKFKPYPVNEPFNLIKYINMQEKIRIPQDCNLNITIEKNKFLIIDKWLNEKINNEDLFSPIDILDYGVNNSKQLNKHIFTPFSTEELIPVFNLLRTLQQNHNHSDQQSLCNISKEKFKTQVYKNKGHRKFINLNFKKGEIVSPSNPGIAMLILNQDFINLITNSTEIIGIEKEQIFENEYKDNIPYEPIRYYKFKDGIKLKTNEIRGLYWDMDNTFYRLYPNSDYNINHISIPFINPDEISLDNNGYVKYFSIYYGESYYGDGTEDYLAENEILKIADRLPQDEAIKHYKAKKYAEALYKREKTADEYIKKHKSRYEKVRRKNPNITPIQFMDSEIEKDKKYQATRLAKILKQIEPSSNNK